MLQQLYWYAPVWEIVLIGLSGLLLISWLFWCALRTPNPAEALRRVNPVLDEQPLFFFSGATGLQPLNRAGRQLALRLTPTKAYFQSSVLTDLALEALIEDRAASKQDWPEAGQTALALPLRKGTEKISGLLLTIFYETVRLASVPASVTAEPSIVPAPLSIIAKPTQEAVRWIMVDKDLQIHPTQPFVYVQRKGPTVDQEAVGQEEALTYLEETLLRYLLLHCNAVQRAEQLFAAVWPDDEVDRIGLRPEQKDRLRRLVYQVRQRIEPDPRTPRYLQTAHGVGYTLYSKHKEDANQ